MSNISDRPTFTENPKFLKIRCNGVWSHVAVRVQMCVRRTNCGAHLLKVYDGGPAEVARYNLSYARVVDGSTRSQLSNVLTSHMFSSEGFPALFLLEQNPLMWFSSIIVQMSNS